jgi:hypothetical protein
MIFAYTALEISYLSRSSQLEAVARLKLKLRGQKLYEASMICAYTFYLISPRVDYLFSYYRDFTNIIDPY